MKILKLKFKKDGFYFTQLTRHKDIVIYKKTKPGTEIENWEVCYVQSHKTFFLKDKKNNKVEILAAESLPSSNTWGTLGWSFINKKEAFEKFDELVIKNFC